MRPSNLSLAKYVPLIKFVGGPHPIVPHTGSHPHPCAPNNLMPGSGSATQKAAAVSAPTIGAIAFESRAQLSKRFRYTAIEELEIDEVNTGGAEYIF